MPQTTKHARHKRRRAAATRVKRGGMKLAMVSQRALMMENLMYGILFSPHVQSSMPLGLQIRYLLQAPPPNCESMADSRNILYHSTIADTDYMPSKEKTLHQILKRHGNPDHSTNYFKYCAQFPVHNYQMNGCTETLLLGCKAEMELKKLIEEVIQLVKLLELAQPQDILKDMAKTLRRDGIMRLDDMQGFSLDEVTDEVKALNLPDRQIIQLYTAVSALPRQSPFVSLEDDLKNAFDPQSWPILPIGPEPMQLMENFKCDADNFSRKIMNLYYEFKAHGKNVYRIGDRLGLGIISNLVDLSYIINKKMNDIKESLMVKINMLEIARDLAGTDMLRKYREGESNNTSKELVPEFLFSEDPVKFTANVGAFMQHMDEAVAQLKYIMGIDSHFATTRLLREISRLPSVPRALTSLRLAPPSPAVGKLRYDLSGFKLEPHARLSLTEKSAFKKFLVERLTDEENVTGHGPKSQSTINTNRLIGL